MDSVFKEPRIQFRRQRKRHVHEAENTEIPDLHYKLVLPECSRGPGTRGSLWVGVIRQASCGRMALSRTMKSLTSLLPGEMVSHSRDQPFLCDHSGHLLLGFWVKSSHKSESFFVMSH